MRRFGDFAEVEDAVQEAVLDASVQWPRDGIPDHPQAWLIRVATRRMIDKIRSDQARRRREADWGPDEGRYEEPDPLSEAQDALTLLFLCCHPALSPSSAVALTLRAVCGLTTSAIAKAFFVPEATMAQRISRAKQKIKESGQGFVLPSTKESKRRLNALLQVLYLMFNEGYASSSGGDLQQPELTRESLNLTRLVCERFPHESEASGLLALLLLTDARRVARSGPRGQLIPLEEQERSLWDRQQIEEGVALLTATLTRGPLGVYQIQAAIAAVHDEAPSAQLTDWPQLQALYGLLSQMTGNPMVTLNLAVAAAQAQGTSGGWALLKSLEGDPRMTDHHRLHAVRGFLHEKDGDLSAAAASYLRAAGRTDSLPEREYLADKASRLVR